MPVALRQSAVKSSDNVSLSGSIISYAIPEAGQFTVRLLDVSGAVAASITGEGPLRHGKLPVTHPGLYFLEVNSKGGQVRHPIRNF